MNKYLISHKIRTTSYLWKDTNVEGYTFKPFDGIYDGTTSCYWLAEKEMEAPSYVEAQTAFRSGLMTIIDGLAVVTQCAFSMIGMSFCLYRLTENPDSVFFFYMARDREPVKLSYSEEEKANMIKILECPHKLAIHYLRESHNASMAKTRLSMLINAVEACADQKKIIGNCQNCGQEYQYSGNDKEMMKSLLGEGLYKQVYGKGGMRHKFAHGEELDEFDIVDVADGIYRQFREFLKKECDVVLPWAKNVPRTFNTFEYGSIFLRNPEAVPPSLFDLEQRLPPDPSRYPLVRPRPSVY